MPILKNIIPVYVASASDVDRYLDPSLCANPLPFMAATIAVLSASEASPYLPDQSKQRVTDAIRFLGERLATVVSLADPSAPAINTTNILPTGAQRKGPARTMLQDIARGLARRVPLTKLVALDADVRPYLAALMVSALHRAGEELVIPDDMKLKPMLLE